MDRQDCDRMFVAVMETGSFARAAARLGASPGQASKLVARLESDLGVRLLNRTTRALSATEVGQAYFEGLKRLLDEFDALDQSVRSQSGIATGRLRLTAPVSFGTAQLTPALIDFARAYPAIDLDVTFSDRVVSLIDEGFDAAVRVGRATDTTLIAKKLCHARIVIATAPAYLATHGEPNVPADLAAHDCILDTNFREPSVWRFRDPATADPLSVDLTGRLRFSSTDACIAAAQTGLGIARAPSFIAGERFRDGRLKPLLTAFENEQLPIHVLYPPGRHLATKVRVLVDFLAQRFHGQPSWDFGW